ncbi:MAG: hypothetical protein UY26_C0003G0267 [Candidatus Jorgensenbacteria bacterium GW2011_GWA1_48_13]|uniref:Uncharacterized protein n=2 Tax=Candidatus Joergenseniibacteriota TaxID=1752739 RepID=A0A0G1W899_9BACT|nr:MAG: hypothetical protein UY26_C0003G0267 [Candidatus Jorgensenbacteria bacterium GW2011_GWA1_48_13]KKU99172.1 MAG: hypothetical protein UY32_C0005G0006 [Candidatus Jorgensenbacteria bacterium GW2011_GWC1_48_8]KKW14845.1 MAG: hypothetical protein UY55_C0003G0061 [Candidatus Jorgensenbacteria bacterium GW2011_GWB1_50_10]
MAKKTDELVQFAGHFQSLATAVSRNLEERGVNVVEAIAEAAKPQGARAVAKIVDALAELVENGKRVVGALNLIVADIAVKTELFTKNSFFGEGSPVKLYIWDNFRNWVLTAILENIPAFQGMLVKHQLTKGMYDSEILSGLGHPTPFSPTEFAAVIRDLISKQSRGEEGLLLTNGYANIFYVQLPAGAGGEDARVVAVRVTWNAGDDDWHLDAYGLDDDGWGDGVCVFSRS